MREEPYVMNLQKLEKNVWIAVIVFLVLSAAVISAALYKRNEVKKCPVTDSMKSSLYETKFNIDSRTADTGGNVLIHGWFVEEGAAYPFYNFGWGKSGSGVYNNYHLAALDNGTVVEFPTLLSKRDDVTASLNDGTDYKYAGFSASIPASYRPLISESGLYILSCDPSGRQRLYFIMSGGAFDEQ